MKLYNMLFAWLSLLLLSVALAPETAYPQQSSTIILAGYNHAPPVSTPGSGLVTVSFKKDTLRLDGDFSDLTSPYLGAYVMVGEKGEDGNVLLRLNAELNENRTGGVIKRANNVFSLNEAQKQLLKKGELYINITSSDHSHGELRGQIPPMK